MASDRPYLNLQVTVSAEQPIFRISFHSRMSERPRRLTFSQACAALGVGLFENEDYDDHESSIEEDGDEVAYDVVESDGDGETAVDITTEIPETDIYIDEDDDSGSDTEDDSPTITESDSGLQNRCDLTFSFDPISPALRRRNILRQTPGPRSDPVDEISAWRLFHTDEIFCLIMRCTNRKISHHNRINDNKVRPFGHDEFMAALAILYRAGVDRDNFSDVQRLFHSVDSRPFYRAAMSVGRFKQFLRFIRFDNILTRGERQSSDRLAAFSDVWKMFMAELPKHYVPESDITVDEQLVGYRGHAPGRTYMPSKPRPYGVKIYWATESTSGYALTAIIYTGRGPNEEPVRDLGKKLVLELLKPYYNTGRNVVTDNFFTSYSLAVELLSKNLTLLGTIRKNRREVPICLSQTRRMEKFDSK